MKFVFLVSVVALFLSCYGYETRGRKFEPRPGSSVIVGGVIRDLAQEAKNKEIVLEFYNQVFGKRDLRNIETFLAPMYTQHNPNVPDGREGFIKWAKTFFPPGTPPNPRMVIERSAAERDLVFLHVRNNLAQIPNPAFDDVIMDIYRMENGLIVEHFDVVQIPIPQWAQNQHPLLRIFESEFQPRCGFNRNS